jgi:hypothetical protein
MKKKSAPMMRNGRTPMRNIDIRPVSGFSPFQDSSVPAATRSLRRSTMVELCCPTQVARIRVPAWSAISTRIS